MIRRFGEPRRTGISYRIRHGVYAILPRGRRMLITYQGAPHHEYQLPGGGVDPGESPLAALHREVFEETGWRIAAARKLGCYRRFTFMPEYDLWAEKLCHIYAATPVRPHGPPTEAGHTAIWMDQALVPDRLASPGDRQFARHFIHCIR